MARIGIMGGTFDPVHLGHLHIAAQAKSEYRLEEIWFMPSRQPAYKEEVTGAEDRAAMVRLAIQHIPGFVFSDYELRRKDPYTYTSDTLRLLRRDYPQHSFFWIVGEDSIRHITGWHEFAYILQNASFLAAQREDEETMGIQTDELTPLIRHLSDAYGADIHVLHCKEMDISSSEIRRQIRTSAHAAGWRALLPDKVADYIERRRLYR